MYGPGDWESQKLWICVSGGRCFVPHNPDQGRHSMELSKLSKSPSLLRSPTIKSGIDSLSSLEELDRKSRLATLPQTSASSSRTSIAHHHARVRERLQLLIPPAVIVAVTFIWWCMKSSRPSYALSKWLSLDIVPWYWFNVSALLVLVAVFVTAPHLFGHPPTWRDTFGHLLTNACAKKEDGWEARSQPQGAPAPRRSLGHGEGVQTFSNGDVYEGELYKGKFSGSGVYYFYKSGRYEGTWVDGRYDGYGVETWARGSRYRGQYRQGMREGYGIYRFYTGDVYSGYWSNGQSHGCGMQTCGDGSCYVGEFKWGVKHGVGSYHFRNGDTYAGEYFADNMHGYGVYKFANSHRYEGSWHDGRKQGLGIYTFRNGDTHAGHWHLGTLESRSTQVSSVNHSRVLNAVQEARKVAQRGMVVEKVDDRVKRAVALANQAASAARVAAVKSCASLISSVAFV